MDDEFLIYTIFMSWLVFGIISLFIIFFIVRWHNRRVLKEWNKLSRTWAICPECGELIYPHHLRCCGHEQAVNPDLLDDDVNVPKTNPCSACGRELLIHADGLSGWTHYNRPQTCPQCGKNIGRYAGMFPEILIPLLGATGVGKSAYLSALASQLKIKFSDRLTFPFPNTTAEYMKRFENGKPPRRTDITTQQPPGFMVDIQAVNKKKTRPDMRLFFYDPAGEVYNVGDNYAFLHCLDLMDGTVILIDPLSIPKIRNRYSNEQLKQSNTANFQIGRDTRDVVQYLKEEIYQRTYRDYEYEKRNSNDEHFYLDGLEKEEKEHHYARCAVVITKCDAFDLDELFGEAAIQRELSSHPELSYENAMDAVCVRMLQETWGSELQFLKEIFADVRCFSVSSFGCMPGDGKKFDPQRVELPLFWLLQSKYAKILGKIK